MKVGPSAASRWGFLPETVLLQCFKFREGLPDADAGFQRGHDVDAA